MGLTFTDQLADQVEIEATIDGNQFLTISKVLYKATVNEPRSVTIQISDKESLLKARLGAVLKLNIGRGDTIHNLDFEGIVKVIKEAFIDKTDKKKRFVAVQVRFQEHLKYPVSLEKIKKTKTISHLPLIKQSRLSVMPIDYKSWKIIYKMGKIKPN